MGEIISVPIDQIYTTQCEVSAVNIESVRVARKRGISVPPPKVYPDPRFEGRYFLTDGNHRMYDIISTSDITHVFVEKDDLSGELNGVHEYIIRYLGNSKIDNYPKKLGYWNFSHTGIFHRKDIFIYEDEISNFLLSEYRKIIDESDSVSIPVIPGTRSGEYHAVNPELALVASEIMPNWSDLIVTAANSLENKTAQCLHRLESEFLSDSYSGTSLYRLMIKNCA